MGQFLCASSGKGVVYTQGALRPRLSQSHISTGKTIGMSGQNSPLAGRELGRGAYEVIVPVRDLHLQFRRNVYVAHLAELGMAIQIFG